VPVLVGLAYVERRGIPLYTAGLVGSGFLIRLSDTDAGFFAFLIGCGIVVGYIRVSEHGKGDWRHLAERASVGSIGILSTLFLFLNIRSPRGCSERLREVAAAR